MMMMTKHMIMGALFSFMLLIVCQITGMKMTTLRNKNTPFECGFDPKDSARLPFSMRFFLLAVIFLIFDIEIALLFPIILGMKLMVMKMTLMAGFVFLVILMIGVIHEWMQGSLSWVK